MTLFKFTFLKNIIFLLIFYFSTIAVATEDPQQSGDFDYDYIFEQGSVWIDKDIITKDPSSFISLEFIEEKKLNGGIKELGKLMKNNMKILIKKFF